ncbi:MAG TPA: fatty acid desaturase [Myxococcaceae bacterium]|nr:fatty acid desaturase [Myxococcaceae bacterium]
MHAPMSSREVAASFPVESVRRCEALALLSHAVLLGSWGALAAGVLAPGWFVLIGLCAFVRNFNALHQHMHAPGSRSPFGLHLLMNIVASPLQIGNIEAGSNHRQHHAYPKAPGQDPDAFLNSGPWWRGLVNAATQPEQALVRWVRRRGWSPRLRVTLAWNVAVLGGMFLVGGPRAMAWWLLLTRVGHVAAWFIFDWVLHHDAVWGSFQAAFMPPVLPQIWRLLFGRENLDAVRHHTLHHVYPFVRDRDLAGLSRLIADKAREAKDGLEAA